MVPFSIYTEFPNRIFENGFLKWTENIEVLITERVKVNILKMKRPKNATTNGRG